MSRISGNIFSYLKTNNNKYCRCGVLAICSCVLAIYSCVLAIYSCVLAIISCATPINSCFTYTHKQLFYINKQLCSTHKQTTKSFTCHVLLMHSSGQNCVSLTMLSLHLILKFEVFIEHFQNSCNIF